MTVIVLTSASSSPWAVPSDWNNAANQIECIGEGGAGGTGHAGTVTQGGPGGGGGGGGAYATRSNVSLSGTVAFVIGAGGSGTDTSWNSGSVVAKRGTAGGNASASAGGSPAAGGAAASCTPSTGAKSGGNGATGGGLGNTGGAGGAGAGGAGGPNTAGQAGLNGSVSTSGTGASGGSGGQGDGTFGGAGGGPGSNGHAGTELGGGAAGAGGGSGGGVGGTTGHGGNGGNTGGNYGGGGSGGGGGAVGTGNLGGAAGFGQGGAIIITYTPLVAQTLGPTQIATSSALDGPALLTAALQSLGPTKIATSSALDGPALRPTQSLGPTKIATSSALDGPALALGLVLGPTPIPSSAALYPPSAGPAVYQDCWTLYYNAGAGRWILDGGNGTLQLTTSRPYRCQADNTFDTILVNATGLPDSAIPAITLWPLSDPNCVCPDVLGPFPIPSSVRMRGPTLLTSAGYLDYCGFNVFLTSPGGYLDGNYMLAAKLGPPSINSWGSWYQFLSDVVQTSPALGFVGILISLNPSGYGFTVGATNGDPWIPIGSGGFSRPGVNLLVGSHTDTIPAATVNAAMANYPGVRGLTGTPPAGPGGLQVSITPWA